MGMTNRTAGEVRNDWAGAGQTEIGVRGTDGDAIAGRVPQRQSRRRWTRTGETRSKASSHRWRQVKEAAQESKEDDELGRHRRVQRKAPPDAQEKEESRAVSASAIRR